MAFLKKNFALFFILAILATTLTACGDKEPSSSIADAEADFHGEGEVQGGIKSDDELAALAEEAASAEAADAEAAKDAMLEAGEAANVEMDSHEPEAYGSGNFQDYWEGDDYFDLVSYLKDNGCLSIYGFSSFYEPIKDGETAGMYVFFTSDKMWQLSAQRTDTIQVIYAGGDWDNIIGTPTYVLTDSGGEQIKVDATGMTMSSAEISALDSILSTLKVYNNDLDPLQYTNLNYTTIQ